MPDLDSDAPSGRMRLAAPDLGALAEAARRLHGVRRGDLQPGDRLLVATRNSVYSLAALADGTFLVSGGWYQRQGMSSIRREVHGCTAGGRALFAEIVAAPGLYLEFGDGMQTTRIVSVRHLGGDAAPA
ncbi:MAG: hypothetical protein U0X73_18535 [Thermoanaerobaculia bacterium]